MGLTMCSHPGFTVLQLLFRLGKQEKGSSSILLGALLIRMALAKTAMTSPSCFYLPSLTMCQLYLCCVVARRASLACEAVFLFLCVPHAFFTCSTCFSIQNAEPSWLVTVIDKQRRCVCYKGPVMQVNYKGTVLQVNFKGTVVLSIP